MENQPQVSNEPGENEKQPIEIQDFRRKKITDHFKGMHGMNLKLIKEKQNNTTCNQVDLETPKIWLIMPKMSSYVA